jgi:D-aspartate ligase
MSALVPACVIGDVDIVVALGLAGIRSIVVAKEGNPSRYSRYAEARVEWADPWLAPEALVDRLLAAAATQPGPPVLYFDGDWDLLLVSRHRERLGTKFRFVVADADLVEAVVDKGRFQALADELDLPVPSGVTLKAGDDVRPALSLQFPLVVKPLTRQHEVWRPIASSKAMRIDDGESLRRLADRCAEAAVDVLIQEAIPGPESRIESYHAYVDGSGAVAGEFTGRKLRTFPKEYGYSTALTLTESPEITRVGREIDEKLGLRGVVKLDFKRDDKGRLHLLEVNPRFNLWHHLGARAGVNLPALVYADLVGLPRPNGQATRSGLHWCSLAHDYHAAREAGISRLGWGRWMLACEAKSGFSLRDPFPLPRAAMWRLEHALLRSWSRRKVRLRRERTHANDAP